VLVNIMLEISHQGGIIRVIGVLHLRCTVSRFA
jgi:hypothetical protein